MPRSSTGRVARIGPHACRGGRADRERVDRAARRPGGRGGARVRGSVSARRGDPSARGTPGGPEGRDARRGVAHAVRLAGPRRDRRAYGAGARAHLRRRRRRARADVHARVQLCRLHPLHAVGHHEEPVEPRGRGRRLERRLGRVAREWHVDARERVGHRRLDQDPGIDQWGRRLQGAARARADLPAVQPRSLLPRRRDGAHDRRHGAVPQRAGRPAPARHDVAATEGGDPSALEGIEGLRIALSVDLGSWDIDDEVAANTRAAARGARDRGRDRRRGQAAVVARADHERGAAALRRDLSGPTSPRFATTRPTW